MRGKGAWLTAGLTALDELLMLAPHRADEYDEAHPAVPSNRALHHLTKLTRLQLQASMIPSIWSDAPSSMRGPISGDEACFCQQFGSSETAMGPPGGR